uniref:Uncharacterized protein n=1 Tax=Arundo donax TaxID=35708 RepID=A0A0A9FCP9_ARUDO
MTEAPLSVLCSVLFCSVCSAPGTRALVG